MSRFLFFRNISHPQLGTFQTIRAPDPVTLELRVNAKLLQWERQWRRQCEAESKRQQRESARLDREAARQYIEDRKRQAEEQSSAARAAVEAVRSLLAATVHVNDAIDFASLKDHADFAEAKPARPQAPPLPQEPVDRSAAFEHAPISAFRRFLEWLDSDFRKRRLAREAQIESAIKSQLERTLRAKRDEWQRVVDAANDQQFAQVQAWKEEVSRWEERRAEFQRQRARANDEVDLFAAAYARRDPEAVERYSELVLDRSIYPDTFPKDFSIVYVAEARRLLVEYVLPAPEQLPRTKSVKYIQSRDEFEEAIIADAEAARIYDSAIYQIVVRSLHELAEADVVNAVSSIAMNGVVDTVDKATGQPIRPCIVSVVAPKDQILALNLAEVDPKACFRKFKGVGSAQLHLVTPVPPIIALPTDDPRYVSGREVLSGVNEGVNLAAMDWEEFEHLVRELCERKFASVGADVRVTQASRDGGVDAVIMDPDELRGGTIVVQAKRYTNVVPVAAVRELYGTMMNEGAMKGILVTTSTFGGDSYEFKKGKPITLIDGSHLLHLLGSTGTKAHIDLVAARRLLRQQERDH